MTVEEMRKQMSELLVELPKYINKPRSQCRVNTILMQISMWSAAAEICERLDRLAGEDEDGG